MISLLIILGLFVCLFLARKKIVFGKRFFSFQNFVFLFNFSNLIIFGIGFVSFFPLMLLVSAGSSLRMMIILWIALIGVFSLISLFKPKFTFLTFVFFGLLGFHLYIDNPMTEKKTSYVDICNDLRNNSACVEGSDQFICGDVKHSKSKCINQSGGNDEYKFEKSNSPYLGKTYTTQDLSLYLKNMPRNQCKYRSCGYKYDTRLVSWNNSCLNCLGDERVTTPLRLVPVKKGTQLKVIEAFKKVPRFSFDSGYTILVLQDSDGHVSEIYDFQFDSHFSSKPNIYSGTDISKEKILSLIDTISPETPFIQYMCLTLDDFKKPRDEKLAETHVQFSKYIELRLLKFIDSFDLENEMEVTDTSWRKTENRQGDDVSNPVRTCAKVMMKSASAYLLLSYYGEEWGLYSQNLSESDMGGCLPKEYAMSNSKLCEKLEGQIPFTVKNWKDLEKSGGFSHYTRDNEDLYLK